MESGERKKALTLPAGASPGLFSMCLAGKETFGMPKYMMAREEMQELSELERQRHLKLERIRERGIAPYPARFHRTHTLKEARQALEEGRAPEEVAVAGRLMSIRIHGRVTFAHIRDESDRLQIYLRSETLPESYADFVNDLDIGDFIGVWGKLFRTRTEEITVEVKKPPQMLAKSLRPLPEKWHGLRDVETRYRQRYLDLLANEEVRRIFRRRTEIISAMRRFLDERGFLEVETPVLQPIYGGAAARPFTTYHRQLGQELYLRISSELYLKRLIVAGFGKVYEIGKDFRNEGISTKHNPEFTQMELYQAYADYNQIMELVEEMFAFIVKEVLGTKHIVYQGQEIDLAPPWRRLSMREAIEEATGIDIMERQNMESLLARIDELGLRVDARPTWGKLVDEIFSEYVEPKLIEPTFIMDYPLEVSPLAKKKEDAPGFVERFEPYVGGLELGNAFSELNDPEDQRERFLEQARQLKAGDEEAHPMDEDFLLALEYGMPPTGGLGIGVDRLTMLLTDQRSIREVILFPHLRSKA